jgi:hypothetical protein
MFQPIQIETQSEQQGLTHLHGQRATWGTSREFSFDRREQALDQGAAAINPSRECASHLGAHSVRTSCLHRKHAAGQSEPDGFYFTCNDL